MAWKILGDAPRRNGCKQVRLLCTGCNIEYARDARKLLKIGPEDVCGSCTQRNRKTTHGLYKSAEYRSWNGMLMRCLNPKNAGYKNYGGRGITVFPAWRGVGGFENFLRDVGNKPTPQHSLDRRDVNGNYEPGNVRWATSEEQANNRTTTRRFTHAGQEWSLQEIAKHHNIAVPTLRSRLNRGWSLEDALTKTPARFSNKQRTQEGGVLQQIRSRCRDPNNHAYKNYGGRGIQVAPEWCIPFRGLKAFMDHIGPRPSAEHSVERIDNDVGYVPGDVRWATRTEQARNRRSTRYITAFGETRVLAEWAERVGIRSSKICQRIDKHGWSPERALSVK